MANKKLRRKNGKRRLDSESELIPELNDEEYLIYCDHKNLHLLNNKLTDKYGQTNFANLIWKSDNSISVEKESAEKLFKLLNTLEENEDVQLVSSNFEVSDEILTSLTMQ